MHEIWSQIIAAWQAQSGLELIAVIAAILYLILAIKENIWCWFFAIISTGISVYLLFDVKLMAESLLHAYYFFMAFYGWFQWHKGQVNNQKPIVSWSLKKHFVLVLGTAATVPILASITLKVGADLAYLDAFTTCFAILATVMVAHKVLENWHYWLIVNILSVYLYFNKGLYLYSAMYVMYVVMTIYGLINWTKNYAQQD